MVKETSRLRSLRTTAERLRRDVHALGLACRDPRVPWYAKAMATVVVAYALSPIDLIPDFIPVVGYLDDLVLIPLGIALVVWMVPDAVMADCRARATTAVVARGRWIAATLIIALWLAGTLLLWQWYRPTRDSVV